MRFSCSINPINAHIFSFTFVRSICIIFHTSSPVLYVILYRVRLCSVNLTVVRPLSFSRHTDNNNNNYNYLIHS